MSSEEIVKIRDEIINSHWMTYINRSRVRSFTLNIFQMNHRDLVDYLIGIYDPDKMVSLVAQQNLASLQIHREVNRFIHNFVASAMTLVDNTRSFMGAHYKDTFVECKYKERINEISGANYVIKFVQDLRNYMLHYGLPPSQLIVNFTRKDNTENNKFMFAEAGLRYETATLKKWTGWKAQSRNYMDACGDYVDIRSFVDEYTSLVLGLHGDLTAILEEFHNDDFQNYMVLENRLKELDKAERSASAPNNSDGQNVSMQKQSISLDIKSRKEHVESIERNASFFCESIREINPIENNDAFKSERSCVCINKDEVLGQPSFVCNDASGDRAFVFIERDGKYYGFHSAVYDKLVVFCESVVKERCADSSYGSDFVFDVVLSWLRERFYSAGARLDFMKQLCLRIEQDVKLYLCYAPIANFEIESNFSFGKVSVVKLSSSVFDSFNDKVRHLDQDQVENFERLLNDMRGKMQGLAAIYVECFSESFSAVEFMKKIAEDAMMILRFFSPSASDPWHYSVVDMLGNEAIPISNIVVAGKDSFVYETGIRYNNFNSWRLSSDDLKNLMNNGLELAGNLIEIDGLSDFGRFVRKSILEFSKGMAFVRRADRLMYVLTALESVFLVHPMEHAARSVGERVALFLSNNREEYQMVFGIIGDSYKLHASHGKEFDNISGQKIYALCIRLAHEAIRLALLNLNSYDSKMDFVDAVQSKLLN